VTRLVFVPHRLGGTVSESPALRSRRSRVNELFRVWVLPLLAGVALVQVVGWLRSPSFDGPAPDFALKDLAGQEVHLSDYKGRTVILNFWATWCAPCRAEIPSFSAFASKHPEIAVLGVAADGTPGQLKAAAKSFGITYPVLIGDPATLRAYQIGSFPTTVVIGPDGDVRTAHVGLMFGPQIWWATR